MICPALLIAGKRLHGTVPATRAACRGDDGRLPLFENLMYAVNLLLTGRQEVAGMPAANEISPVASGLAPGKSYDPVATAGNCPG